MSHFVVLVITNEPGEDAVSRALAPYHEFECTGTDDEFVQNIDITAETRSEYEKQTTKICRHIETGEHFDAFDDRFYRKPTPEETKEIGPLAGTGSNGRFAWNSKDFGFGYETRVRYVPEGFQEIDLPTSAVKTFREFIGYWHGYKPVRSSGGILTLEAEHKFGYVEVDERGEVVRVVQRTNPNKKWDWYQIGGRWTGYFKLKNTTTGLVGKPGLMTDPAKPGYADQAFKADIDVDGMRAEAAEEGRESHRNFMSIVEGLPLPTPWAEFMKRAESKEITWDQARVEYNRQPAVMACNKSHDFMFDGPKPFLYEGRYLTEDEYAQRSSDGALATFAVLKDGVWYERGSMGWWGCVSGEISKEEWLTQFAMLVDTLPDSAVLTAVDCHI